MQINIIEVATFFDLFTNNSAIYAGNLLFMKMSATKRVPTNIPITFQLMAVNTHKKELGMSLIIKACMKKIIPALMTDIIVRLLENMTKRI